MTSHRARRRGVAILAGALVLLSTLTACSSNSGSSEGDGRLVVALTGWGTETPLAWQQSTSDKPLWEGVFDPMIARDPETYDYEPGLAEKWTSSPDYKTWTFKLRSGVEFHGDWGELTSEDVKWTVEQFKRPDAKGSLAGYFAAVLDRVEAPDARTVVVHLKAPRWDLPEYFAQMTSYINVMPRRYVEKVGVEAAARKPIGTGPYRYVNGRPGELHRFRAVEDHWSGVTPAFDELVIRRIPDAAARLSAVRAGEVDIAALTGPSLVQAENSGLELVGDRDVSMYWVVLPGQTTPDKPDYCPKCPWVGEPDDPAATERARSVRLALNLAVDKEAIIDSVFAGHGSTDPSGYFFWPFNSGFREDWTVPPYDVERARQLLTEAGYPDGFQIKLSQASATPASSDIVEAVAGYWRELGIEVELSQEDVGAFLPRLRARDTGTKGFAYGALTTYSEPGAVLPQVASSTGGVYLLPEYYDEELQAIGSETDPAKRERLTVDLMQRLYDSYPGVMIGWQAPTWAVTDDVGEWPRLPVMSEHNYHLIKKRSEQ